MSSITQFTCSSCKATFNNQAALLDHMTSHSEFKVQTIEYSSPSSFSSPYPQPPQPFSWVQEQPSYFTSSSLQSSAYSGPPSFSSSYLQPPQPPQPPQPLQSSVYPGLPQPFSWMQGYPSSSYFPSTLGHPSQGTLEFQRAYASSSGASKYSLSTQLLVITGTD